MADNAERFTFTWKLEKFSMFPRACGDNCRSPVFIDAQWRIEWFVLLSFDDEGDLVASLQKNNHDPRNIVVHSTFYLESIGPSTDINVVAVPNGKDQKIIHAKNLFQNHHLYLPQDVLTLNCNFCPTTNDSFGILREYCVSRTTIKTLGKSFSWPIRNMQERKYREEKYSVDFPHFFNSNAIILLLTLIEIPIIDCIQIIIKITETQSKELEVFTKCKISVVSFGVNDRIFKQDTRVLYSDSKEHCRFWQFPAFITKSCLDQHLHADGTLLLLCEFTFSFKDFVYHVSTIYTDYPPVSDYDTNNKKTKELITNAERFYSAGGKFCDVVLRAGDDSFPVHKFVLCAMSPLFEALLENDTHESGQIILEVPDVEPATLKRMLAFMYCDVRKEDLSQEDTVKLYKAANEYKVESLKRWCSILLISTFSAKSVCDVLVLANCYHDSFLRNAVDDFIRRHRDQVFSSAP